VEQGWRMDYFKIMNLKKEPFSNSPEPEFFFHSSKHQGCLQKLEIAIRLRRGLSVIIGDVGTGKTTLCRQLILKFSDTDNDREQIETHLLMDPSFSEPIEFLTTVSIFFGIYDPVAPCSEWQMKENIKNYLFKKGVDEDKIVILIIDEGQKLPDFCLEILREFLNYETNERKLLQIVIFAQKEFEPYLQQHANFADRVNQYYMLEPLNFWETRDMIRFRLAIASGGDKPIDLFSLGGLVAVYRATGGYPRKIITLCHQVILTLIIQNRSKAGWSLVHSCALRLPFYHVSKAEPKRIKWVSALVIIALLVFILMIVFAPKQLNLSNPFSVLKKQVADERIEKVAVLAPDAVVKPTPQPEPQSASSGETRKPEGKMPDILGKLTVRSGGTVFWLLRRVYADFKPADIQIVKNTNPHIKDINNVRPGDVVKIPAIPNMYNPLSLGKGNSWVQIARKNNLDDAYKILLDYPRHLSPIRLFSYWNSREGTVFLVLLKGEFADDASALNAIKQLPPSIAAEAKVINDWNKDTIFFANR
jgi:general secretion pathway protein A